MEPGMRDSSILLLYHQPQAVFLPLRRLNSVAAESKHKLDGPPCCKHSACSDTLLWNGSLTVTASRPVTH